MESKIDKVIAQKGKKAEITLSVNPFRVNGGGQPGDSGTLLGEGFEAQVLDCRKSSDGPVLEMKLRRGQPSPGLAVEAEVDMERHQVLSRMHSGEHLLSRVMENSRSDLQVYKVAVGEERTSVFFRCPRGIQWEFLFEAEEEANRIAAQNLPVTARIVPAEDARHLTGLKANWDRIDDGEIRVVEIQDFDKIACSGSHVEHTGQIGRIYIESFKGGPEQWELVFSLGDLSAQKEHCRIMRQLLHRLHCRPEELGPMVERLSQDNKSLSKTISKIRSFVVLPREEIEISGVPVFLYALTGIAKDIAMASLSSCCNENPGGLVLALLYDGESQRIPFVLMKGRALDLDPRDLKSYEELDIRGGGSADMLSGLTSCRSQSRWLAKLEQWIGPGVGRS